jgi:hypothetical protein
MSRRQHEPTNEQRQQAMLLSGYGIPQEQIATMLHLDAKTLRLHYRRELDVGLIQANAAVARSLYRMAVHDKVPAAAIFWMKARAGWKDRQDVTIEGTQTVQLQHLVAARAFSAQLNRELIEGEASTPEDEPEAPLNLMQPALE